MNHLIRSFFLLTLALAAPVSAADESVEPPINYTLIINGKAFDLNPQGETSIPGKFTNPKVKLQAAEHRRFGYGGVKFHYPAQFTWEAAVEDEGYRSWTLSGNDVRIMFLVFDSGISLDDFVNRMISQYKKRNCRTESTTRQLGEKHYPGTKLTVTLAGTSLVQEFFLIASGDKTKILMLQDFPQGGQATPEAKQAERLMRESFKPAP